MQEPLGSQGNPKKGRQGDLDVEQDEPSPAQAEVSAPAKEWSDLTRCPAMNEADKDDEVVNPERRIE